MNNAIKVMLVIAFAYYVFSTKSYLLKLTYIISEDHKIITQLIENDYIFIKSLRVNGIDDLLLEKGATKLATDK